jgi:hypothetical protein
VTPADGRHVLTHVLFSSGKNRKIQEAHYELKDVHKIKTAELRCILHTPHQSRLITIRVR